MIFGGQQKIVEYLIKYSDIDQKSSKYNLNKFILVKQYVLSECIRIIDTMAEKLKFTLIAPQQSNMGSDLYGVKLLKTDMTLREFIEEVSNNIDMIEWGDITIYKFDESLGSFYKISRLKFKKNVGICDCTEPITEDDYNSQLYINKHINCLYSWGSASFDVRLKR